MRNWTNISDDDLSSIMLGLSLAYPRWQQYEYCNTRTLIESIYKEHEKRNTKHL